MPTTLKWLKLDPYSLQQKCSPKNIVFDLWSHSQRLLRKSVLKTVIFYLNERKLTIRLVQHCAAISAIAELLLYFEMVLCSVVDALCFAA